MLERCPNCKRDVLFSRDICPECGRIIDAGERIATSEADDGAEASGLPQYDIYFSEAMTASQRRGRILVGLVIGVAVSAPSGYFILRLFWFRFDIPALAAALVAIRVVFALWDGRGWARGLTTLATGACGLAGLYIGLGGQAGANLVIRFLLIVFGTLFVLSALTLGRSREVAEFLRFQRTKPRY